MSKRHAVLGLVCVSMAGGCAPQSCDPDPDRVTVRIRFDRPNIFAPHQKLRVVVANRISAHLQRAEERLTVAIDEVGDELVFTTSALEFGEPYTVWVSGLAYDGCNEADVGRVGLLSEPEVVVRVAESWSMTQRGCESPPPWDPSLW